MLKVNAMPHRDPQCETPVARCGECGGEVYHHETMFWCEGKWICSDCYKESMKRWIDESPTQVADAMGIETEEV